MREVIAFPLPSEKTFANADASQSACPPACAQQVAAAFRLDDGAHRRSRSRRGVEGAQPHPIFGVLLRPRGLIAAGAAAAECRPLMRGRLFEQRRRSGVATQSAFARAERVVNARLGAAPDSKFDRLSLALAPSALLDLFVLLWCVHAFSSVSPLHRLVVPPCVHEREAPRSAACEIIN